MNTCAKTRLAKVDGEKLPEVTRDLKAQGDQSKNNLNPHCNKFNGNRKLQADAVLNKSEAKPSNKDVLAKEKRDIIAENITKQGKRSHVSPVKRIPATSNFIYEFNSFVDAEQSRPLTSQTHLLRRNKSEQTLPYSKTDLAKRKSSTVLPELNSRIDFVTVDPDSNVTNFSLAKNTYLPTLGREDSMRTLNKQIEEYERGDIDREVENVKSAWQALREEKSWTKGKDRIDSVRMKKLYETLEKMTSKIDSVQRNYMDPKANHYLRRSATSVLRASSKPSLQEEAEIVRSIIFPDRKGSTARIRSAVSRLRNVDSEIIDNDTTRARVDEAAENISADIQRNKNFPTAKKRSVYTEAHDVANDIRSIRATASNACNKKQDTAIVNVVKPFTDDGKTRARIKSSIEEYLQHYSDNIHKPGVEGKEEEYPRDVKPSASDIADILASHNIGSHVLYENFERHSDDYDSTEDYTSENDAERFCSNTVTNATQATSVDISQENRRIRDDTSFENYTGLRDKSHDARSTKAVDARSLGTRRQSSVTNCQDNAFIEMGLNKNLSRDTLSQILQSEYLRKDLSL
ncbi:PREDICTED: uncharacterized protein LOC105453011 isoform X2 [Wasmannia auropunctata]|uniref:uncharacterized protein LOC105453011 isoform X2 n=1 Tax=Wasmannia auropunctata TaxID=64793 RepID=UPI0005EE339C|nr:PREDICTED: uncharacterized protein LOC105453011 isoform X2 [Wasmannia auropunctata]